MKEEKRKIMGVVGLLHSVKPLAGFGLYQIIACLRWAGAFLQSDDLEMP
jgi:hypothetical protein